MKNNLQPRELVPMESKTPDYVASAAKAVLGSVPFVGSLLAEVAGTIIPNQRVDRIAKFAAVLEKKLREIEQDTIRAHLTDENFTDVIEEALRQAARSVTDDRRAYIASIVRSGITEDSVEFIESKHLLRILGEINDIEVLWLRFHLEPAVGGDKQFRQKHSEIFDVPPAFLGSPQDVLDKNAMKESYLQHLAQLGLLQPVYQRDPGMRQPEIDSITGAPKLWYYKLSTLGGVLLRHVGLAAH